MLSIGMTSWSYLNAFGRDHPIDDWSVTVLLGPQSLPLAGDGNPKRKAELRMYRIPACASTAVTGWIGGRSSVADSLVFA